MARRLSLVIGVLLAGGAFVGLLLLGSVLNPTPYRVVVAIRDVQPGEILTRDMVGIDAQIISPRVAQEYMLEDELDQYIGEFVVRQLVPGQPLMHHDVVADGNPAAYRRIALVLEDPDMVVMTLPVEEEQIPDAILPGDHIAIVWSVGEQIPMFETVPGDEEITDAIPGGEGVGEYVVGPGGELIPVTPEGRGIVTGTGTLPPEVAQMLGVAAGQELVPELSLPFAKSIVNVASVIDVRREKESNPAYTGGKGESPYIPGKIIALDLAVRRDEMEAVRFAIANGEYSIVILSPRADMASLGHAATLGVTWQDIEAYFLADRMRALGVFTTTETVRPAGAAEIYAHVLNPQLVTPQPVAEGIIVPEPTRTAASEEAGTVEATPEATPRGPLATATPRSQAGGEVVATATATPVPVSGREDTGLGVNIASLVAGLGCVVAVVGSVALVTILVIRRLRKPKTN